MNLSLECQTQLWLGLFEKEIHCWLKRFCQGIATAIDIGAAEGEYTLFFLLRTPAKTVFAFEPDTRVLPMLEENLRANALERSSSVKLCTEFVASSGRAGDGRLALDSLLDSIETPCLIKVDVDGAEMDVLKGAGQLNSSGADIRWLIETHSRKLENDCAQALAEAGFNIQIIHNAWWRRFLPELRPIEHNRWLAAWR
jgi:predicted RNA methylase